MDGTCPRGVPWLRPSPFPPAQHILFMAPITLLSVQSGPQLAIHSCTCFLSAGNSEGGKVEPALYCGHGVSLSL